MHIRLVLLKLLILTFINSFYGQFSFDTIFNSHPLLKQISLNAQKYHLQIIYTQINYENNAKSLTTYSFNVSPQNYFYCASLVKLPVSILALQKLNEINVDGNSIFFSDSSLACHKKIRSDTSSENNYPSINHYIKKMFLVSDNYAYSAVYDFLGVDYMHQSFAKWGFKDIRIINRYSGTCFGVNNFITNPVSFYDEKLHLIYKQNEQRATLEYKHPLTKVFVGKSYKNVKRKINIEPKNFTNMNYVTLNDCHAILQELIYNQKNSFNISKQQRDFLILYLGMLPRQSKYPKYNYKTYHDSFKKYLFYGNNVRTIKDSNLVITNIVGQSYGFLSDCAHFYDKKNKVEFLLSAAIYTNECNIISKGKYEFATIGFPSLAELGKQFYNYELKRKQ